MLSRKEINFDLLVLTGPTAAGKTALAAMVASLTGAEIISADSRQIYRGMDIGTGKDLSEYIINGRLVPFHLIDIAEPGYKYSVFEYQRDFLKVYSELCSRGVLPIVCGGSGMYIDSIVSGYRLAEVPPDHSFREEHEKMSMEELTAILKTYRELHNVTDLDTKKRVVRAIEIERFYAAREGSVTSFPRLRSLVVGVSIDRDARRAKISQRLRDRLDNGMIDEVKRLMDNGVSSETLIYYGLEYKYITQYLTGVISFEEMFSRLETEIHRFAKRQMTWFRGMERKGTEIHWIDSLLPMEDKAQQILKLLAGG
jgi:tRNA dimethylallyltransferase